MWGSRRPRRRWRPCATSCRARSTSGARRRPDPCRGMSDLGGRVALVTGGARGIGRAIAELLAGQGASVVLGDLDPGVAAVAAEIDPGGGSVVGVVLDVRSHVSFEA